MSSNEKSLGFIFSNRRDDAAAAVQRTAGDTVAAERHIALSMTLHMLCKQSTRASGDIRHLRAHTHDPPLTIRIGTYMDKECGKCCLKTPVGYGSSIRKRHICNLPRSRSATYGDFADFTRMVISVSGRSRSGQITNVSFADRRSVSDRCFEAALSASLVHVRIYTYGSSRGGTSYVYMRRTRGACGNRVKVGSTVTHAPRVLRKSTESTRNSRAVNCCDLWL